MEIYTAEEGYVYFNKQNGMIGEIIILGVNDSIDNYEIIPKPEEELLEEVIIEEE